MHRHAGVDWLGDELLPDKGCPICERDDRIAELEGQLKLRPAIQDRRRELALESALIRMASIMKEVLGDE